MNNTKNKMKLLLQLVLLFAFSLRESSASEIDEIRNYLNVRDAAVAFRDELQRAATDASGSPLLSNPQGEQAVVANMAAIQAYESNFRDLNTPLSIYYADRLADILQECNALYPHFIKRRALRVHAQTSSQPASSATNTSINKAPVELPAAITNMIAPQADTNATASIADLSRQSAAQILSDRHRAFFQPIGVRTLIPYRPSTTDHNAPAGVTTASPAQNIAATTSSASENIEISSIVQASEPPQLKFPELPKAASTPPAAFTPLEPWPQGDPQIRNEPGMRPLAIMIENHNQARPQTGLHEAEVVYEIPVEGGITRFMALYYHVPQVVGPIRSCREYFVDRALEVNALYVHCGGSPNGYKYLDSQKVFSIDEISNGSPFYRDSTRKPPHNLYAKPQQIIEIMNKRHPMELPYQRLPLLYGPNPTAGETIATGLSIRYHGNYTVTYKFNPATGRYDRYMNGMQHLDRVTLQPIAPGTVVLQVANMRVIDDAGRQEINFIGEGRGIVLYAGTATPLIWNKSAPREFTKFYDASGKPFIFSNKSPVWIQVIAPTNQVAFEPPLSAKMLEFLALETKTAKSQESSIPNPPSSIPATFSKDL